jgi:hypothetical protein
LTGLIGIRIRVLKAAGYSWRGGGHGLDRAEEEPAHASPGPTGPMGPMADRTPHLQPAVSLTFSWGRIDRPYGPFTLGPYGPCLSAPITV